MSTYHDLSLPWDALHSQEDRSVNHIAGHKDGGFWEARYVQRVDDYFICYLSSHTGCAHSCRFCHLTASKQTMMTMATIEDYLAQADKVFSTYRDKRQANLIPAARRMHFNFMARGEALSNRYFLEDSNELFFRLGHEAGKHRLSARFLVSTIMPRDFDGNLRHIFHDDRSVPYYSLYSMNPEFRRRWLPKAMDPTYALQLLAAFQKSGNRKVVLHWAFIRGENDSVEDVDAVLDAVEASGLKAKFNLVRYNPHDKRHGEESSEEHLQFLFDRIDTRLKMPGSRIVPRVGVDVHASCGTFFEPYEGLDNYAELGPPWKPRDLP